ncbi:MAG: hypothetical protein HQL69_02445 [Magnetococcales bacterium]|nr:hypothetical protein [Magnetococcales bacterium]
MSDSSEIIVKTYPVELSKEQIEQILANFEFMENVRLWLDQKGGIFTVCPPGGRKHQRIKKILIKALGPQKPACPLVRA